MRRALAIATFGLVALGLPTCGDGTVRVDFRPEEGATYRYEVRIRSESETVLAAGAPQVHTDDVLLVADHTVVENRDDGVRVRVVLAEPGGEERTFEVVFDRAAQLESIESLEGVSTQVLGDLGLSELFPAAAGGPPDRPLAPGDRWDVDVALAFGGAGSPSRLTGTGRLVELGVEDGREVARLESSVALPVRTTRPSAEGELRLDGTQVTDQQATRDLTDGAVRRASSQTVGRYDLTIMPPTGTASAPVTGSLTVTVRSETRRLS